MWISSQSLYLNEYQLFKSIFSKKAAVKSAWNNFIKPNIKLLWQIQKSPPPKPTLRGGLMDDFVR